MNPAGETRASTESVSPQFPAIVWERQSAPSASAFHSFDQPTLPPGVKRFVDHCCAVLSRPTFSQIHGRSPMETTRIIRASVADAADVLGRVEEIEWGRGRSAGQLRLGPFTSAPGELGRPWVADAILDAYRIRRLRVSVAIVHYGNQRCGIQIRPGFRRPWSSRRLRRCLRSTHGAADRLGELVVAVDFTPPRHAAADTLSA